MNRYLIILIIVGAFFPHYAVGADWPMLGRNGTRNSVSVETNAPIKWCVEQRARQDNRLIRAARGIRWAVPLGTQTHSSPVVSQGLVWIGTNNAGAKSFDDLHSVLKCFRASDGKLVYEYDSPKLGSRVHDPGWSGLGSSPLIEGDRLWLATNRSEVFCLDIGPLIRGEGAPREIWRLDLIKRFDISPFVPIMGPPRPCSIGPSWNGRIFVTTNNGVSEDRNSIPKPEAPNLICLDKDTGEVYWTDHSPGENILMTQFASPTVAEISGQVQVIVPQSDGWVRAFHPQTGEKLWEFDVNPKSTVHNQSGRGDRNSLLGNAVVYQDRVYIASGQDAEQGEGPGRLVCIDPTKRGDVSSELAVDAKGKALPRRRKQAFEAKSGEQAIPNPNSALVWEFSNCGKEFEDEMHRLLSSVVVANNLVIAADAAGLVHCFDAKTGKRYWAHDTLAAIWATPLIVGDKIYISDDDGDMAVFQLGADSKYSVPLATVSHLNSIHSSPVYANGTLYVANNNALFAIDAALANHWSEHAGNWPQWRGPNRDNRSSDGNLLRAWPTEGPPLSWRVDGLGEGIASLSLADGRVFTSTTYGNSEYAIAMDEATGERLWGTKIGTTVEENSLMRWLSQRTPTVDGNRVYTFSNSGWLVCLDAETGSVIWRVSYPHEYGTPRGKWGFCDRPLIDGDRLICTPGGSKATIVALDKQTGKAIWSKLLDNHEAAGYAASLIVDTGGIKQYVVSLDRGTASFAAKDGRFLWRYDRNSDSRANSYTPLSVAEGLLCPNGYGSGIGRLKLINRGEDVLIEELYFKKENLDPFEDSTVLVEDRLYAFAFSSLPLCLDINDGSRRGKMVRGGGSGKAAATYADGRLYARWSDGTLALLRTDTPDYVEVSRFKLPDARPSVGATFPVVTGGRLYVRDNDRLFSYDVSSQEAGKKASPTSIVQLSPPPDADLKPRPAGERVPNAIFVPTPQDVVEGMLATAKLGKDDVVYDLGSGDGRIVIEAAKQYGCRAIGIEVDRDLVELSQQKVREAKVEKLATIKEADLFDTDFSEATVVTAYLYPGLLKRLLPAFERLKPGTRIISHQFAIPDIAPDRTIVIESNETGAKHTVYLWTTPFKK